MILLPLSGSQTPPAMIHKGRDRKRIPKRRRLKLNTITKSVHLELPEHLIFSEILTRLPVKTLFTFNLVSKSWKTLILSPQFIKSHIQRTNSNPFVPSNCIFIKSAYCFYILNYDAYNWCPDDNLSDKGLVMVKTLSFSDNRNTFLIGSSNGLVCFGRLVHIFTHSSVIDYCFYVYNPILGQYQQIFDPLGNFGGKLIYGFGFVSSNDDYRMFVGGLQKMSDENFMYVYSLRSKEWKKIDVLDVHEFSILRGGRGVLVNKTLHWDITQVRTSSTKKRICGFDLVDETFKYIPLPKVFSTNVHYAEFRLCEMGGSLCVWAEDKMNGGVEMWMLKEYGECDSWMKMFKTDMMSGLTNFHGITKYGKVLVQTAEGSLMLSDTDESFPQYTTLVKDLDDIEVVSYIRSPVSPFLVRSFCNCE